MRLTKLNKLSGEIERLGLPQQLYKKLYEYEEAEEQGLLVKVTHCKDCKYYGFKKGECNLHYFNGKMILKNDNDFCSRAEVLQALKERE